MRLFLISGCKDGEVVTLHLHHAVLASRESVSLYIKWIIKSHVLDNIHNAGRLVPKEKLDIYLHMGLGLKIWGSLASAQYILEKLRVEPNFEVCRI